MSDQHDVFVQRLAEYKSRVDADIEQYSAKTVQQTEKVYGTSSALVADTFTAILSRGGKRIRSVLTLVGYEMCGGTDNTMIVQAARAIEMMHAYVLIIDDVQDKSALRRGGPSAHKLLETHFHAQGWKGDAAHAGVALSLNAALLGMHHAELALSTLPVSETLRIKALNIMNHTMMVTLYGQTHDIINESVSNTSLKEIENVMQWKTAHYTILNPIHMGMVLAGAGCEDTNAITQYALHVGKAFQITDDLLIVSDKSGKDGMDDIREGKRTLPMVYALQKATNKDKKFLLACLGNEALTEDEFKRCKEILLTSGAIEYAQRQAADHVTAGLAALYEHAQRWDKGSVSFLEDLANYIVTRTA